MKPELKQLSADLPAHSNAIKQSYRRDAMLKIADRFDIFDWKQLYSLWGKLDSAAALYERATQIEAGRGKDSLIKQDIQRIKKLTGALTRELTSVLEGTTRDFRTAQLLQNKDRSHRMSVRLSAKEDVLPPGGVRISSDEVIPPSLELTLDHLNYLMIVLDDAVADAPVGSAGAKSKYEVRGWIETVSPFWENELGRPVKVDQQHGEPITEYGEFMQTCFSVIEHRDQFKTLQNQLAEYRTEKNRSRK